MSKNLDYRPGLTRAVVKALVQKFVRCWKLRKEKIAGHLLSNKFVINKKTREPEMQIEIMDILMIPQKPLTTLAYASLYLHCCQSLLLTIKRFMAAVHAAWDRADRVHREVLARREEMELQKIKSGHFPRML